MAYTVPWHLIGTIVSGDVAGLTIYTDKRCRKVTFAKAPPLVPPSPAQIAMRARFRLAQSEYMAQSDQVKREYENATLKASLPLTGQNLWISVAIRHDLESLRTVSNQTGIDLTQPTFV